MDPVAVVDRVGTRPVEDGRHCARRHALGRRQVEALVIARREDEPDPTQPAAHIRPEAVEDDRPTERSRRLEPAHHEPDVVALVGLAPDPVVIPGQLRLHEQPIPLVARSKGLEDVQRPIKALARRRHPDEAEVELGTLELWSIERAVIHPVRDHDDLARRPARDASRQGGVGLADTDHPIDSIDRHLRRPDAVKLEPMQADDEPLARAAVVAVPDRIRPAPLADDDVGPVDEILAGRRVVLVQTRPLVEADLHVGQRPQVIEDRGEELEVVARHPDPVRTGPRPGSEWRRIDPGEHRPKARGALVEGVLGRGRVEPSGGIGSKRGIAGRHRRSRRRRHPRSRRRADSRRRAAVRASAFD